MVSVHFTYPAETRQRDTNKKLRQSRVRY